MTWGEVEGVQVARDAGCVSELLAGVFLVQA